MDEYSKAILDAIKIVVDRANNELARDLTVQGEIVSIVDLDTGEYRAKQNGAIITVYSRIPEEQYEIGEKVYITVPEGDFSNLKIIFGRVKRESLAEKMEASSPTRYNEASPYLDTIFNFNPSPNDLDPAIRGNNIWGLTAGVNGPIKIWQKNSIQPITWSYGEQAQVIFRQYAKYHNYIELTGSFWNELKGTHITGNYGIEVGFYIDNEGNIETRRLDFSSFNGDPMHYATPSPQSIIIETEKDYYKGLAYIKFFQENFAYDKYEDYVKQDDGSIEVVTVINNSEETPNLFAKDINLRFVDKVEIDPNSYYLHIATPNSNSFISSSSGDIELIGQLLYQNKNIYSSSSCSCLWFERDVTVTVGTQNYDSKAGIGWKKLNETSNILTLANKNNNWYSKEYKLVMIYKDRNIFTQSIKVYNLYGAYAQGYNLQREGNILRIEDLNNSSNYPLGKWYIQYPNNAYEKLQDSGNTLDISDLLIYSFSTISCAVLDGDNVVTILDYQIVPVIETSDVVVTYEGNSVFRYDANGDLALDNQGMEFTIQPKINWSANISSIGAIVQWLDQNGNPITNTSPQNPYHFSSNIHTMFQSAYVDENNVLHFFIKNKYRLYLNDNTLSVQVILNGQTYTFTKEFIFLKDGDQGTNGTKYITYVRPVVTETTTSGGQIDKLQYNALLYKNGAWQTNTYKLKCFVYRDGEEVPSEDVQFNWELCNDDVLESKGSINEQTFIVKGKGTNLQAARYVKVTVTITDDISKKDVINTVFYPVDVIVLSIDNFDITKLELDAPLNIQYSSSGYQPTLIQDLECIYNNDKASENAFQTTTTNPLFTVEKARLRPAAVFDASNNKIADTFWVETSNFTLYHTVICFLNTFGNEAINSWDGTSLVIENGENGGEAYVLAPQIGAGIKDSKTNKFTGVVMGEDSGQQKIGLYGYQKGINTFGLTEDGIAYFGKSGKGRIVIDGDNAVIYGGNGDSNNLNVNGMILTLYNTNWNASTKAISIGEVRGTPAFYVTYNGKLSATGATISGKITADEGKIGNWTIDEGAIKSTRAGTYLGANGYIYADQVYLTGGRIGGWSIGTTTLTGGATKLNSNGIISTNYFTITGYGSIGAIDSWSSGATILGIQSSNNGSIAIEASGTGNAVLRSQNGSVSIQSGQYQLQITNKGTLYGYGLTYGGGISGLGGSGGTGTAVFG